MKRVSLVLTVVLFCSLSLAARAGTEGLAYDQIGRVLINATPPPPDSFAEDAARIAALPPLPSGPRGPGMAGSSALGLLSAIPGVGIFAAMAQQAAAMAYVKSTQAYTQKITEAAKAYANAGGLQQAWFYKSWSRIDNQASHAGVISMPDKGEQIFLNFTNKTYRMQTMQMQHDNVETYVASDDDNVVQPGDFTLQSGAKIERTPAMTISGESARGYRTTVTFTTTNTMGWCAPGVHELSEVEYVADIHDPQTQSGAPLGILQIAHEACEPTTLG
ncbi:MAG: hypothetical protein JO165_03980, partial [Candidatus Eremiobacteraeota bacterium]|nr:hypothetical protein [Candidatus Eremiobacteraeota bacterium]